MANNEPLSLVPVEKKDLDNYCMLLEEAFQHSVGGPPVSDDYATEEVKDSFGKPGHNVMWVMEGQNRIGGAVVVIDEETQHNMLMWFFIAPDRHSCGIGTRAWEAIEKHWPKTRVWEVGTPYCDKRNVNFYINKCGFHAVEFYNAHHPAPWESEEMVTPEGDEWVDESFRFEKVMQPSV